MNQKIGTIEMVSFKLKEGVNEQNGLDTLMILNECVKDYPGFISRKILKGDQGQWIDLVYWTDKTSALKAAESIMSNPKAMAVFEIIDQDSLKMEHLDLAAQFKIA